MANPEQKQTAETEQSYEVTTTRDATRRAAADKAMTVYGPNGVTRPTPALMHRKGHYSTASAGYKSELSTAISHEDLEKLDALRQQLIADAAETFGEELVGDALVTYDHLRELEVEGDFDGEQFVLTVFDADDQPRERIDEGAHGSSQDSEATKYITRVYRDAATGRVEKTASYPVPYRHGNGILIARETGDGNLDDVEYLLHQKDVTKKMFRELTGAARVNHVGTPESVRGRIQANLNMPIVTFLDDSKRASYVKRQAR